MTFFKKDTSSETVHKSTGDSYRSDIDGLRAIAVMMVVGFHAFPSIFKGGFIGVDVFFIISGYLISNNLIKALNENKFSLVTFYEHRIKRIFPALLAMLVFCYAAGYMFFTATEFKQLGKHIAAGSVFLSNIAYMQESGYFDVTGETKPLLHLWSLGVEEQFYIVFPLLLWLLWRFKTKTIQIIVLLAVGSFFASLFVTTDPSLRFYSPQTRIWELLLGTLLALWQHEQTRSQCVSAPVIRCVNQWLEKYANAITLLGLCAIVAGLVLINPQKDFPGWWALLPTCGTIMMIGVGMRGWINKTVLSHPLFVWIGLISYPIYLWHWPLLSMMTIIEGTRPSIENRLLAIALTFMLSIATYSLIEKPLRFGKKFRFKTLLLTGLMAVVGLVGYMTYRAEGYPERVFAQQFKNVSEAIEDWEGGRYLKEINYLGHQVMSNSDLPPEILFIGDSHMEQFLPRLVKLSETGNFPPAIVMMGGGCPLIPRVHEDSLKRCDDTFSSVEDVLNRSETIKKIVIGGCWNCYFLFETKKNNSTDKGFSYYFSDGKSRQSFRDGNGAELAIGEFEKYLRALSMDREVYLLLDNPFGEKFNPRQLIGNRWTFADAENLNETIEVEAEQIELNEKLKKIAQKSNVEVIDQLSVLCPQGKCIRLTKDKKPIFKDSHHLRPFFIRDQADYFERQLFVK